MFYQLPILSITSSSCVTNSVTTDYTVTIKSTCVTDQLLLIKVHVHREFLLTTFDPVSIYEGFSLRTWHYLHVAINSSRPKPLGSY